MPTVNIDSWSQVNACKNMLYLKNSLQMTDVPLVCRVGSWSVWEGSAFFVRRAMLRGQSWCYLYFTSWFSLENAPCVMFSVSYVSLNTCTMCGIEIWELLELLSISRRASPKAFPHTQTFSLNTLKCFDVAWRWSSCVWKLILRSPFVVYY